MARQAGGDGVLVWCDGVPSGRWRVLGWLDRLEEMVCWCGVMVCRNGLALGSQRDVSCDV